MLPFRGFNSANHHYDAEIAKISCFRCNNLENSMCDDNYFWIFYHNNCYLHKAFSSFKSIYNNEDYSFL